jgi:plasmid stabilization system protein ParE
MRVRWTAPAAQDLYKITQHIRRDNPKAAREVAKTLYHDCESLVNMPNRGRKGRKPGTRELVFRDLAYIVVYALLTTSWRSCISAWSAELALDGSEYGPIAA